MSKKRKVKCCDPEMCDNCMYIGEGDFFCDRYETIVVDEWSPTEDYLICMQRRKDDVNEHMG